MLRPHVWVLVLVAGKSERFEGIKAMAPWRDGSLLSNALGLAQGISAENVCVVLGRHVEPLQTTIRDVFSTVNPNWEQGMGSSIGWGVRRILEKDPLAEAIVILPVDQPFVSVSHLEILIQTSKDSGKCALTSSTPDIQGPPAVLHRRFFEQAAALEGKKGLKAFLKDEDFVLVQDPLALEDIDTRDDLARLSLLDSSRPSSSKSVFIASHATKLSLVEIVLGSVVHGLHIPFGGNIMSLNQGAFLCRATQRFSHDRRSAASVPLQVSSVSSVLKSLSPAGQKLGPMIAIGMQGILYSLSILFLGPSRVSQSVGMIFLSLWSFVQPILMLWLFYGESLPDAAVFFYSKLKQTVPALADLFIVIFVGLVSLKALVGAAIPWVLSAFGVERFDQLTEKASSKASRYFAGADRPAAKNQWEAIRQTFRDLTRPAFLIPCLLVTFFLVFSETKNAQWIWKMLRPLAVATLFFYLTNTPWMHSLFARLKSRGHFPQFFSVLEQTKVNLSRKRQEAAEIREQEKTVRKI